MVEVAATLVLMVYLQNYISFNIPLLILHLFNMYSATSSLLGTPCPSFAFNPAPASALTTPYAVTVTPTPFSSYTEAITSILIASFDNAITNTPPYSHSGPTSQPASPPFLANDGVHLQQPPFWSGLLLTATPWVLVSSRRCHPPVQPSISHIDRPWCLPTAPPPTPAFSSIVKTAVAAGHSLQSGSSGDAFIRASQHQTFQAPLIDTHPAAFLLR